MNDPRIGKLRQWLEKDLILTMCAKVLMFNIYSHRVCCRDLATEAFKLPWKLPAKWCGLTHKGNVYDRTEELVRAGYMWDEGVKGCPPTATFKLNLKLNLNPMFKDGVIPP